MIIALNLVAIGVGLASFPFAGSVYGAIMAGVSLGMAVVLLVLNR